MPFPERKIIIAISAAAGCVILFAVGIIIGQFAINNTKEGSNEKQELYGSCGSTEYTGPWVLWRTQYLERAEDRSCYRHECHTEDLPKTYQAHHLQGKTITLDGRLDDDAWREVPWSSDLLNIRGKHEERPYFDTRFKVRWDDERLYVGAWMEEKDFWGNMTDDESLEWTDNSFEVFAVPDGSMHNYKQIQISVQNKARDVNMKTSYMDRPPCTDESSVVVTNWSSDVQKSIQTDAAINDPSRKDTYMYWSVEWSFRFDALAQFTERTDPTPQDEEVWFFNTFRQEYWVDVENGQFVKDTKKSELFFPSAWQPMHTVNLHLPSRFGLVQFTRDTDFYMSEFHFPKWHIYRALFEVFEAQHRYKAVNGMFISDLAKLDVAPKIMSIKCVEVSLELTENETDFQVNVRSRILDHLPTGHIRADRYVWFTRNRIIEI